MNKTKSSTRVARSKFLDRIKTEHECDHKQNLNLNDIRQSSYKLPKSNSHHRNEHSLQRKQPLKYTNIPKFFKHEKDQHEIRQDNNFHSANNTMNLQFQTINTISNISNQKSEGYNTLAQLYQTIKSSTKNQVPTFKNHQKPNEYSLKQEEQLINYIKIIWQYTIKIKQKWQFTQEIRCIQNILKQIIMKIIKPKLNIYVEKSNIALIPQSKYSPLQNIKSFKEFEGNSNHNSVKCFNFKNSQSEQEKSESNKSSDHNEDIQFKKIMYILEEQSKKIKDFQFNKQTFNDSIEKSIESKKQQTELKDISNVYNLKINSHQSSFNHYSSCQPNSYTIGQFQKINNSHSNDKIFLKNIVKKVKNTGSNLEKISQKIFQKKGSSSILEVENISRTSSQSNQLQSVDQESNFNDSGNGQTFERDSKQSFKDSSQKSISQQVSVSEPSEQKRKVLNDIISMLNKKYNKNIHMQPRQ